MFDYIWLIPVLPMIAAILIALSIVFGINKGETGERPTAYLLLFSLLLSFIYLLVLDFQALFDTPIGYLVSGVWFKSGDYQILLSFNFDALALTMATLITFICIIAVTFSINYLHREAGFQRFFMVMGLFSGAMLLIFTAGNVLLTFCGWELAGVSSYLLICYFYDRDNAAENATRVFITNRVGDVGFILSITLSFLWFGSLEYKDILNTELNVHTLYAGLTSLGFIVAAMVKSALVPFSPWISRALEGPTPSSAVFYGSLMVHSGIYLMIRMYPLIEQALALLIFMNMIGILTVLYGWLSGLVQTDVKSSFIFSTTTQIGFMFIEISFGLIDLVCIHMMLHMMWRAYQFLHAPAMMHLTPFKATTVPPWLQQYPRLFTMALQRFWLDYMTDWLMVRATKALAQDLQDFEIRILLPLIGFSNGCKTIDNRRYLPENSAQGTGFLGHLMCKITTLLAWFEEGFILKGSGEGMKSMLAALGVYLIQIDSLLSQPRYLLVLIMATFAVII